MCLITQAVLTKRTEHTKLYLRTEHARHNVYSDCYEKKLNTRGTAPFNRSNLDTHAPYDREQNEYTGTAPANITSLTQRGQSGNRISHTQAGLKMTEAEPQRIANNQVREQS